jgi:hypothetical protein
VARKGNAFSVEPSASTSSKERQMQLNDKGCSRANPGRGKSSGTITDVFESVVRASSSPTPELEPCGWLRP